MKTIYDITSDAPALTAGVTETKAALKGLDRELADFRTAVEAAFSTKQLTDYQTAVSRLGKKTADGLLTLRLNFGRLKVAAGQAIAPVAEQLLPVMNRAVRRSADLASTCAGFFHYLINGNAAFADSAADAAEQEENLEGAVTAAGKAARRSLLSFDRLHRLNAPTGASSAANPAETPTEPAYAPISPELMALADRIRAAIQPLTQIDLSGLRTALTGLATAFGFFASTAAGAVEGLWHTALVPFLTWALEQFAPVFTELWASAMTLAAQVIGPVSAGVQGLLQRLQPIAAFIAGSVVAALEAFRDGFGQLGTVFAVHSPQITGMLENIGTVFSAVWLKLQPALSALRNGFLQTFQAVGGVVAQVASGILTALYGVSSFLAGTFTGDWERSWEGIKTFFKGLVNGIIGLLNALLSRLGSAINAVVRAANRLRFTVPDWVPGLGGSVFGLKMSQVSVPQIPYLARGAVLPANKPFLAVVGDQKSGTNIEAPLDTITEAVRGVTGGQSAALAGQLRDSVTVQRQILEAVLGIRIGDEVIGAAAQRFNRRQSMMTGGCL